MPPSVLKIKLTCLKGGFQASALLSLPPAPQLTTSFATSHLPLSGFYHWHPKKPSYLMSLLHLATPPETCSPPVSCLQDSDQMSPLPGSFPETSYPSNLSMIPCDQCISSPLIVMSCCLHVCLLHGHKRWSLVVCVFPICWEMACTISLKLDLVNKW